MDSENEAMMLRNFSEVVSMAWTPVYTKFESLLAATWEEASLHLSWTAAQVDVKALGYNPYWCTFNPQYAFGFPL